MPAELGIGGHRHQVAWPIADDERTGAPNRVALLARGADEPSEQIHTPAGRYRLVPDVNFTERARVGVPGDAPADLAPCCELAEVVADDGTPSRRGGPGQRIDVRQPYRL